LRKFSNKEYKKPNFCHGLQMQVNQDIKEKWLAAGFWRLAA